jgi:hypothetical protein
MLLSVVDVLMLDRAMQADVLARLPRWGGAVILDLQYARPAPPPTPIGLPL